MTEHQLDNIINEGMQLTPEPLAPHMFDLLLFDGWRLLGHGFVRHNIAVWDEKLCRTTPLRVRLDNFDLTKSQRKILRQAAGFRLRFGQIKVTDAKHELFLKHVVRFKKNIPTSLHNFVTPDFNVLPVPGGEFTLYDGEKLIAASYFHLGGAAVNSTYAMFDPEYARFSLGHFTMLVELMYAKQVGRKFYYLGYVYDVPSQMDYKRNFKGLEAMDWTTGQWQPIERQAVGIIL